MLKQENFYHQEKLCSLCIFIIHVSINGLNIYGLTQSARPRHMVEAPYWTL